LIALVRDVAARTGQYWCPIKHGLGTFEATSVLTLRMSVVSLPDALAATCCFAA